MQRRNNQTDKKIRKTKEENSSSSDGKESAFKPGDPGSVPGSRRSPGEGNGNPFQ